MPRVSVAMGACLALLFATTVSAQTASVSGRVTNAQGAPIADADVLVRPVPTPGLPATPPMPNMPGMTANERAAKSGADGRFTVAQVPPGAYVLQVDAPGFERSSQEIV